MKGSEVVASLKGILNSTTLRALSTEDKIEIKHLLDLINYSLFSCNPFA